MAERLPRPVLQVGFNQDTSVFDCLRSAHNTSRQLRMGILFVHGEQEFLVQPEMPIDVVLSLADPEMGQSVLDHLDEHRN
jgi:hypothetical protein